MRDGEYNRVIPEKLRGTESEVATEGRFGVNHRKWLMFQIGGV